MSETLKRGHSPLGSPESVFNAFRTGESLRALSKVKPHHKAQWGLTFDLTRLDESAKTAYSQSGYTCRVVVQTDSPRTADSLKH